MQEFSVNDLEGALILISCNTVELDDNSIKYNRVLPHTIREGSFRNFELDGQTEYIDHDFQMDNHEDNILWSIDLDSFETIEEVAQHILRTDGKEIISALYFNEEIVVDNRLAIDIYDSEHRHIFSGSRTFKNGLPKQQNDSEPIDTEAFSFSLDTTFAENDKIFLHDRRVVLQHLALFVVAQIAVWIMGYMADWTTQGCWLISIVSALYLTQLWWCNIPHKSLGSRLWDDKERRAKGRPWINGGALSGAVLTTLIVIVDKFCGITHNLAHYYLFFLLIALCMTCVIWGTRRGTRFTPNVEDPKSGITAISETLAKQRKQMRRAFWKEFFRRLLPWNW